MKFLLYFLLISNLLSCARGYGTAYVSDNLTIYYSAPSELTEIKLLAEYWNKHNVVGEKKQFLRLFKPENGIYELQLIASNPEQINNLKFEELKLLQDLENELNKEVFHKIKIDLVLCDSRFKVINDLNF